MTVCCVSCSRALVAGGFSGFSFQRHIPRKGFSGLTGLCIVSASVAVGFAYWSHFQRIENEKRLARQQERVMFMKKLDKHMHKKYDRDERHAADSDSSGSIHGSRARVGAWHAWVAAARNASHGV